MMSVVMGARDSDTITTLAGRLLRLSAVMDKGEYARASELAGGKPVNEIARDMLDAFDEDRLADLCPADAAADMQSKAVEAAVAPIFSPELRDYLENMRKAHDQVIDNENLDSVTFSGWDEDREGKAEQTIGLFREFLEENKDELEALQIIYGQSYRQRPLTLRMVREVSERMAAPPYNLSCDLEIPHAPEEGRRPQAHGHHLGHPLRAWAGEGSPPVRGGCGRALPELDVQRERGQRALH